MKKWVLIRHLLTSGLCGLTFLSLAWATEAGLPKPTAKDKCPVCGMFVAKYPNWMSAILFKDGSHVFFDGPKDMLKYFLEPKRYNPNKKTGDIDKIAVMDYYSLSPIDSRKAWYILGSDVYGPMGAELVPLEKEAAAREFLKDHKGTRLLKFSDITQDIMKKLGG